MRSIVNSRFALVALCAQTFSGTRCHGGNGTPFCDAFTGTQDLFHSSTGRKYGLQSLRQRFGSSHSNTFLTEARATHSLKLNMSALPSMEEVTTDPFMKQLGHSALIVERLNGIYSQISSESTLEDDAKEVGELLKKIFSHSDGIRGFFVQYLTQPASSGNEDGDVRKELIEAMRLADQNLLVPLICMNVMMPTAMSTMHDSEELQNNSKETARRGSLVLEAWLSQSVELQEQCQSAVVACSQLLHDKSSATTISETVTNSSNAKENEEQIEYWRRFFVAYKYGERQLRDIERIFIDITSA